jgi:hypothetical protein
MPAATQAILTAIPLRHDPSFQTLSIHQYTVRCCSPGVVLRHRAYCSARCMATWRFTSVLSDLCTTQHTATAKRQVSIAERTSSGCADCVPSSDSLIYLYTYLRTWGAVGQLVQTLLIQAGRSRVRFPVRSLDFSIDLRNPSNRTMTLGSTQPVTETRGIFLEVKGGRPACKADNRAVIGEPNV